MAILRFEELEAPAQSAACQWWREVYEILLPVMQNDEVVTRISTTAGLSDEVVAAEIMADSFMLGFLWHEDGTRAYADEEPPPPPDVRLIGRARRSL